jgi:hypothetical protein
MLVDIGPYQKYDGEDERRVKIEFHKYDTYNLDHTLSLILVEAFRAFKANLLGYPAQLNSENEWIIIIDKIIRAHELIVSENDSPVYQKEIQEGLDLMTKYWRNFWT